MSRRTTSKSRLASLILAGCLAACGSPSDPDPPAATSGGPIPGTGGAAASTAPSTEVMPVAHARPARIAARAEPSVEECIEKNIHDKEYDSLATRDTRRKLRRLQVKADCEQRLVAR